MEEIIIPQIIEEDGKRYEVYQESGCISRICIDEVPVEIKPIEPTLEEKVKTLMEKVEVLEQAI